MNIACALQERADTIATRSSTGSLAKPAAAGVLALGLLAAAATHAQARPLPESFADLVEQVAPSVVNISTVREPGPALDNRSLPFEQDHPFGDFFKRFFERDMPGMPGREGNTQPSRPQDTPQITGVGSGFLINPEGFLVTNNHVIAGAKEIKVTLNDGRVLDAELVGSDERTDLALLKVEAERPLPAVEFGDSDQIRTGDWVMAVGNPYGLGGTVTAGIVSARGRDLRGGALNDFLQIDAPINRGNSGGPSFDGNGKVIGINTAIYSPTGGSVGIGFAIPANVAADVIAKLRTDGKVERGWLGVRIQDVTEDIAAAFGMDTPKGALVSTLESTGPAKHAGIVAGDVITAWDGEPVEQSRDLQRLVAATAQDREVTVELWRDRKSIELEVTTGAMPSRQAAVSPAEREREDGAVALDGTGIVVADAEPGLLVVEVAPKSTAARQGLRRGDVIKSIDLAPVKDAAEASATIARLREGGKSSVPVMVARDGADRFLALRLDEKKHLG